MVPPEPTTERRSSLWVCFSIHFWYDAISLSVTILLSKRTVPILKDFDAILFLNNDRRYTDVIKFCYYLGAHNAPKYDATRDRGYYSLAFSKGQGGYLIQGGKNQLVKGINKEGKERYFALSEVDNFTDYYKRIS